MNEEKFITITLSNYGPSFGPREIGKNIREEITPNLKAGIKIFFNFGGVHLISSGFADELFGNLYVELGEDRFKSQIIFNNFDNTRDRDFIMNSIKNSLNYRKNQSDGNRTINE